MLTIEGNGFTFRDVRYGDEADVFAICRTWTHDGKRFTTGRAERAVHKYVNDMTVQPGHSPTTPDSLFREALIAHLPTGEPLSLIIYTIRGGNDPKNWPIALSILHTEAFVVNPDFLNQARHSAILQTLVRAAFENAAVDVLVHDIVDNEFMRPRIAERNYETREERTTPRGIRTALTFTKENYAARLLSNPGEGQGRHVFTRDT